MTSIQIGTTRIRLGGIDAPSVDQLCLNNSGERWTCGVAARDELMKHVGDKSWTCHPRQAADRRGRVIARCEVDGEDIQKWLVGNGWALAFVRISRDYEPDEKAAREAKAGMWQGAFIAPWDWRIRNKKTTILGAVKPPPNAHRDPVGLGLGIGRALARLHHQGQRQHIRRMHLPHPEEPLVRADPDEDQQGHALVLLRRGRRSRRLPGDATIGARRSTCFSLAPRLRGEGWGRGKPARQDSTDDLYPLIRRATSTATCSPQAGRGEASMRVANSTRRRNALISPI